MVRFYPRQAIVHRTIAHDYPSNRNFRLCIACEHAIMDLAAHVELFVAGRIGLYSWSGFECANFVCSVLCFRFNDNYI